MRLDGQHGQGTALDDDMVVLDAAAGDGEGGIASLQRGVGRDPVVDLAVACADRTVGHDQPVGIGTGRPLGIAGHVHGMAGRGRRIVHVPGWLDVEDRALLHAVVALDAVAVGHGDGAGADIRRGTGLDAVGDRAALVADHAAGGVGDGNPVLCRRGRPGGIGQHREPMVGRGRTGVQAAVAIQGNGARGLLQVGVGDVFDDAPGIGEIPADVGGLLLHLGGGPALTAGALVLAGGLGVPVAVDYIAGSH